MILTQESARSRIHSEPWRSQFVWVGNAPNWGIGVGRGTANSGILREFGRHRDSIECKIKVLKYYLRIVHGDQSLIRAVCYREQLERRDQVTWAGRLRRGLEEIGMGFIIGEDCRNKRNVWRNVKKRLKDIDRQITEGECREKVALEIQSMIKTNWGAEPYLYGDSREGRLGLIWFRLGAWRALKTINEEGARICPLCGKGETSHHILSECEVTEALRKRFVPESFITSSRGHLATYNILNNVKFCDSVGKFMAKVRQLRVELAEEEGAEKIRERVSFIAYGRKNVLKNFAVGTLLYGCETWIFTLREEQRLSVFENKVLRKIFGAKKDEVTGEWRKLHNAELHALHSSSDIIANIKSRL
ncbi:hypothetical protein ANN_09757 [Periplaneta americana]|uniref:Reverse transcriptase n=1 Tax=Periplaneta americana TaxID=6978 RepID=A0ABQ8TMI6_PERAM|nr:hypothetical protein ANN_09757 [Periplaneta americana]